MANTKVSDLLPITGLQSDTADKIIWLDVSDTTQGSGGTLKNMTRAELVATIKAEDPSFVSRVLLETITLVGVTSGEFDFNNIPATYNRLILRGRVRSSKGATLDNPRFFLNEDLIDANYHTCSRRTFGTIGQNAEANAAHIMVSAAGGSPNNSYTTVNITLEDYAGAYKKVATSEYSSYISSSEQSMGDFSVTSQILDAVVRCRLRADNHPADSLSGTIRLYGEM